MKKLYLAHGYNSWTHKDIVQAFSTEDEADQFINGLTDPHLQVIAYKSTTQLVNFLLGAKHD
jgi:hypothetical protein